MGVVTDIQWKYALMEQYPNRKPGHPDMWKRKAASNAKKDIPEIARMIFKYQDLWRYHAS